MIPLTEKFTKSRGSTSINHKLVGGVQPPLVLFRFSMENAIVQRSSNVTSTRGISRGQSKVLNISLTQIVLVVKMVEWTQEDEARDGSRGRRLILTMLREIGQPRPNGMATYLDIPRKDIVLARRKGYNWAQCARFWKVSVATIKRRYKGQ